MKKRTALVAAASAAALAVLPLAASASAAEYTVTYVGAKHEGDVCTSHGWTHDCYGSASFVHDGDHLLVWDNAADGHSVVVEYLRDDENGDDYLRAWNYYGKYDRLDVNMNLAEDGGYISYRVCLGEYGSRKVLSDTCSPFNFEWAK
ncbi:hypothetical protein [Streptomyces coelicoflavus]|uniref:hypothetical protein n=1 Tax=Streptomyces coelicoflavus TaxID=285562 RepID=UPI002E2622DA